MNTAFCVCIFMTGVVNGGAVPHPSSMDGQQPRPQVDPPFSDIVTMGHLLTGARMFTQRLLVKYYFKSGGETRARSDFAAVKPRDVQELTDGSSYGFFGGRGIHFVPAHIRAQRLAAITITGRNTVMPRTVIYYYELEDTFPDGF